MRPSQLLRPYLTPSFLAAKAKGEIMVLLKEEQSVLDRSTGSWDFRE